MSASPAQIEANRSNAQLSTGPRTSQGKQASSQNATKSGLTSATIFVRPEEQEEFEQFEANLVKELDPRGQIQLHLFEMILHAAWNLHRCLELEAGIQNEAIAQGLPDALLDDNLSRKLDRIYRYKKMHESTERRSTNALRQLQTEKAWRSEIQLFLEDSVLVKGQSVISAVKSYEKREFERLRYEMQAYIFAPPPGRPVVPSESAPAADPLRSYSSAR